MSSENKPDNEKNHFCFLSKSINTTFILLLSFHGAEQKTYLQCWMIVQEWASFGIAYWWGMLCQIGDCQGWWCDIPALFRFSLCLTRWRNSECWWLLSGPGFWHQQAHHIVTKIVLHQAHYLSFPYLCHQIHHMKDGRPPKRVSNLPWVKPYLCAIGWQKMVHVGFGDGLEDILFFPAIEI